MNIYKQAMGRFDDAIADCKTAIINDPEVCIYDHLHSSLTFDLSCVFYKTMQCRVRSNSTREFVHE